MLAASMSRFGNHSDVPHTLLPLELAVGLIREKVYGKERLTLQGREGDYNVLASFIAAVVPVYEYSRDPALPPRVLRKNELDGGMFRDRARELRFIDGRATKRQLAVNALDVECVASMLKDPANTAQIHSRFVRKRAQRIRERSKELQAEAAQARREAALLRSPSVAPIPDPQTENT
jgi:hypothetical protein